MGWGCPPLLPDSCKLHPSWQNRPAAQDGPSFCWWACTHSEGLSQWQGWWRCSTESTWISLLQRIQAEIQWRQGESRLTAILLEWSIPTQSRRLNASNPQFRESEWLRARRQWHRTGWWILAANKDREWSKPKWVLCLHPHSIKFCWWREYCQIHLGKLFELKRLYYSTRDREIVSGGPSQRSKNTFAVIKGTRK